MMPPLFYSIYSFGVSYFHHKVRKTRKYGKGYPENQLDTF